jgi:ComF family protein
MPLKLFRSFLDFLTPRTCCACGRRLSVDEDVFCTTCMLQLPFTDLLSHPYDNEMAQTFWGKIRHFEKAYALMYHEPHADSAHVVYQIKYFDKPDTGVDIGTLMGKAMKDSDFLNDIDALLPVPLAKTREYERGFNQSEMIALGIKDATGLPILDDAVKRTTFNGSQTHKDRISRAENVEHAFSLVKGDKLIGKHVLIIDDVVTTGATICSLAKQLEAIEGIRISVASIGFAGERIYNNHTEEEPDSINLKE